MNGGRILFAKRFSPNPRPCRDRGEQTQRLSILYKRIKDG